MLGDHSRESIKSHLSHIGCEYSADELRIDGVSVDVYRY